MIGCTYKWQLMWLVKSCSSIPRPELCHMSCLLAYRNVAGETKTANSELFACIWDMYVHYSIPTRLGLEQSHGTIEILIRIKCVVKHFFHIIKWSHIVFANQFSAFCVDFETLFILSLPCVLSNCISCFVVVTHPALWMWQCKNVLSDLIKDLS